MSSNEIRVPSVSPSPSEDGLLEGKFQPRSKSNFLMAMFRTLSAGSKALMYYGPGSLPHRIMEALAIELSQASYDFRRMATQAVRNSAYQAFESDLFPARFPATYANGVLIVGAPLVPFDHDVTLYEGDVIAASTGATARVVETVTLKAGVLSMPVHVRSEVAGLSGFIPAGALTTYLNNSALRVHNPAPIDGGRDEETDEALHRRFGEYLAGIQTSNSGAVVSAAMNAHMDNLRAEQAALIKPWRVPWMNREMGYAYVVLDAGGGSAPRTLIEDAQKKVDKVTSAGESIQVVPCNPYVVHVSVEVICKRDADETIVKEELRKAFHHSFKNTLIEDGSGRGGVSRLDIQAHMDAVVGVLSINLSAPSLIKVPLGARAVSGWLDINIARGV